MQLKGKTALVTGGARRIGAALCKALAAEGCRVVIHYNRSAHAAEALAARLRRNGAQAWAVAGDFRTGDYRTGNYRMPRSADHVVRQAVAVAGKLDILINNAAVFDKQRLLRVTAEAIRAEWEVNLLAPLLLMQAFARRVKRGRIINLLDCRIASHQSDAVPYSLAKKSLADLTQLAALELAPGITVNGVAPGPVLTADTIGATREPAGPLPLKLRPSVQEVVKAVLFLLESDAITGQIIFVDSGRHLLG
ncbi:MAG: SDR family NAD(P)-dependent oxidoreductase [Verrucomicrobia bacterium]|nr:SDR family NAD(P)-dependent oxidoreductase [Verrucomicrobiota bacterium]MBU1733878.1 SDR family NAD(P)-dependent oxidoreductase [Verrucomicrobiota bacterium]MBU1856296.1 SDR family NAD(P)-dependent oxidoreductase [Verrucomicrobiota bacterium]